MFSTIPIRRRFVILGVHRADTGVLEGRLLARTAFSSLPNWRFRLEIRLQELIPDRGVAPLTRIFVQGVYDEHPAALTNTEVSADLGKLTGSKVLPVVDIFGSSYSRGSAPWGVQHYWCFCDSPEFWEHPQVRESVKPFTLSIEERRIKFLDAHRVHFPARFTTQLAEVLCRPNVKLLQEAA